MVKRIVTTIEAESLADLNDQWKIAAKRVSFTNAYGVHQMWTFSGLLADADYRRFRDAAFPDGRSPTISCVTGRGADENLVLYARVMPTRR